ncbi:MAG: hypothetical protein ACJAZ1_000525 [Yoonia sp.]
MALTQFFKRFPDAQLANPDAPPDYSKRICIHGLRRLDVRLV